MSEKLYQLKQSIFQDRVDNLDVKRSLFVRLMKVLCTQKTDPIAALPISKSLAC